MSCKAYFVRITPRREQEALAKLVEALECPGDSPNNGWFNWCARVTKRIRDPEGRKTVRGQTIRFGYKKGDLVAAVTADNPYLFDWFLTALEDENGDVDCMEIPYFTMLEYHPSVQHENGGFIADDFKTLEDSEYEDALISENLRKAVGFIAPETKVENDNE